MDDKYRSLLSFLIKLNLNLFHMTGSKHSYIYMWDLKIWSQRGREENSDYQSNYMEEGSVEKG